MNLYNVTLKYGNFKYILDYYVITENISEAERLATEKFHKDYDSNYYVSEVRLVATDSGKSSDILLIKSQTVKVLYTDILNHES